MSHLPSRPRAGAVRLVPQPSRWPAIRARLDHEADKAAPHALTDESLAIALLFQHATLAARRRLFEAIRANGCACLRCRQAAREIADEGGI